jgi:hypothetical protein
MFSYTEGGVRRGERERVYIMENKVSFKREKKEINNNNKKKTDIQNNKALSPH